MVYKKIIFILITSLAIRHALYSIYLIRLKSIRKTQCRKPCMAVAFCFLVWLFTVLIKQITPFTVLFCNIVIFFGIVIINSLIYLNNLQNNLHSPTKCPFNLLTSHLDGPITSLNSTKRLPTIIINFYQSFIIHKKRSSTHLHSMRPV